MLPVNWRVGSGLMCKNEPPIGRNSLMARGSLSDMVLLAVQTDTPRHDDLFIVLEGDGEHIAWPEICVMYEQTDFPQII